MAIVLVQPLVMADYLSAEFSASESCDLIELNHFHDCHGDHVFDQLIFWRWDVSANTYHVRAWTMVDCDERLPSRNYRNDSWSVRYYDFGTRLSRYVHAKHFRESWTQRDPERENKIILDESKRISLIKRRSDTTIQMATISLLREENSDD
jgi:hypothetical protein